MKTLALVSSATALALAMLVAAPPARAQTAAAATPAPAPAVNPGEGGFLRDIVPGLAPPAASAVQAPPAPAAGFGGIVEGFVDRWLAMVTSTQNQQPHWVTPLVTVTPRLEQEYRYDQFFQSAPNGVATNNFGGAKGLELIPEQNIETIVGAPAYLDRNFPRHTDGFGDWPFLVKFRLLSADEEHGNYIVTAFMGFSVPTGSEVNGSGHGLFTPTLAFGKGFGDFDIQSTVGVTFSDGGLDRLGAPLAWNTTFQYHLWRYFWPEFETNYGWQSYGQDNGHNTLFLTPGILIGRIPIHNRVGLTFGGGYQIAVTKYRPYNHSVILTARIPF
ncbi:MAG TPA: hypothetical protein VNF29_03680 [Candidatus Binataceae bacterium]|nr:hypothetical protein [Candidatus Binataceae bacterium]